jgi:thiamine kinase-like enzyme
MEHVEITNNILREVQAKVPDTLAQALDPDWLSVALAHISQGARVASVELADVVQAMAAKVRVAITFEGMPDKVYRLCIKGFLDHDIHSPMLGTISMREADFYARIAPKISMRTPPCVALVTDRKANLCVLIMADMIAAGVHFYNALEPLTVAQVQDTLDQLARLHARPELLQSAAWIPSRVEEIVSVQHLPWEKIQQLMHDERRGSLPDRTVDAGLLKKGMEVLAERNNTLPQTILHGDVHPGNVYRTADGKLGFTDWQLIQHGNWSLDVAYHINSVLPVEVAEKEEWELLRYYQDKVQQHGGEVCRFDTARDEYRRAAIYGYYHWAITQRVLPEIRNQAFKRLGEAVTRHDSYTLLGVGPG